ncbi:QRFP-like peptide receptor [Lytechinus pictus]|uniref:QRFP-like peptide receptor n=1 Tax=Lytechinus pictus TaxID=7653 RepID=UPI0030B9D05F
MEAVSMRRLCILVITTFSFISADDASMNVTDTMLSTSFEDELESDFDSDVDDAESEWAWYPLRWTWWLIVRIIFAVLGIIGNGVVIVVIYQRYSTIRSTDVFIGGLAIADFLTSVFLVPIPYAKSVPPTILGSIYCKVLYPSLFFWLCIVASTYILMTMCIERYIAVVFPLYFNRIASKQKASVFVLCIWLVSFLQCLYTLFVYIYDDRIGYCGTTIKSVAGNTARGYYAFLTRLVIPVLIMIATQVMIARSLHLQGKQFQTMVGGNGSTKMSFHQVARNRVIKMMLIVVLVYLFTWTPNQIAYFCYNLGYISASYSGSSLQNILTVLGFINSFANPFIYAARSPDFRQAVKGLFSCSHVEIEPLFSGTSTKETVESKIGTDNSSKISKRESTNAV